MAMSMTKSNSGRKWTKKMKKTEKRHIHNTTSEFKKI